MSIRPIEINAPATTTATSTAAPKVVVAGAVAAVTALVANVVVFLSASAAGTAPIITPPGGAEVSIALPSVALMTVLPVALATVVALVLSKVRPAAVRQLAWAGLVVGIGTVFMPLSFDGDLGAKAVLASMHVITGVAWFVSVVRATR